MNTHMNTVTNTHMPPASNSIGAGSTENSADGVEQTSADTHLGVSQSAGAQHTEADHIAIGATMAQGIQNDIDEPAIAAAVVDLE